MIQYWPACPSIGSVYFTPITFIIKNDIKNECWYYFCKTFICWNFISEHLPIYHLWANISWYDTDSSLSSLCQWPFIIISWQSLIGVSSSTWPGTFWQCVCVCVLYDVWSVIWHHRHEVIAMTKSVPPERSPKDFTLHKTVCVCWCPQNLSLSIHPFSSAYLRPGHGGSRLSR